MIKHFAHAGLRKFFETGSKAGIQPHHADRLRKQLGALNHATRPEDMGVPAWGLHALSGGMAGCWSVSVNANWRLTFRFEDGHAYVVDYQDYHQQHQGTMKHQETIMTPMHNPPHPGAVLSDWLEGLDGITITAFAAHLGVTRATLSRILNGHASITPDIAIRLEEALGASREMWCGMQMAYDLWIAAQKPRKRIEPLAQPAIAVKKEDTTCA